MARQRTVVLLAQQAPLPRRHDEQAPIGQPVDAARKSWRLEFDLVVPLQVNSDDLRRAPVGEPQTVLVPARLLAEPDPVHEDLRLRQCRLLVLTRLPPRPHWHRRAQRARKKPGRRPAVPIPGRRPNDRPWFGLYPCLGLAGTAANRGGAARALNTSLRSRLPWQQDVLADLRRLFFPAISCLRTLWAGARDEPVV